MCPQFSTVYMYVHIVWCSVEYTIHVHACTYCTWWKRPRNLKPAATRDLTDGFWLKLSVLCQHSQFSTLLCMCSLGIDQSLLSIRGHTNSMYSTCTVCLSHPPTYQGPGICICVGLYFQYMYMYTASVRMVVKFMHVHVCSTHTCTCTV